MTVRPPELIRLDGTADQAKATDAINRAIDNIKSLSERGESADAAQADLREAVRKLQESAQRGNATEGSDANLYRRYSVPDERASSGRRVLAFGEADPITREWIPGFLDDTRDGRPAVQQELQRVMEDRAIAHTIRSHAHRGRGSCTPISDARLGRLLQQLPDDMQRAFVDANGEGAEWIPTDVMPTLLGEVEYLRVLSGNITEIEIDRDTNLPYLSAGLVPYIRGAGADDDPPNLTPSSLSSDERAFALKNLSVRTLADRDASEDAILDTMSILRMQIGSALIAGEEDALINGDTGTHQDTGIAGWNPDGYYAVAPGGGSNDHRRAFIGMRARGFGVSNAVSLSSWAASPGLATLIGARHTLKGPKQGPRDVVCIPSGNALAGLAKVSEFQTLDKLGANAYVLVGQIGTINGMPVLESQFATDDLNASGVYDDATKTKGSLLFTMLSRWVRAVKRGHGVRLETAMHIGKNYIEIVGSRRLVYKNIGGANEKNTYLGYNI